MSSEQNTQQTSKSSKVPVIIAVVGVLAMAGAGSVFMAQKSEAETAKKVKTEAVAEDTKGVEDIAPASSDAKPADTAAAGEVESVKIGDPVVAKIGDKDILRSEVLDYIGTLPEQIRQMPLQTLFPLALDQVLNNQIIGIKADQAKMDADPEVTKMLGEAKEQILRNVYVERELDKAVSEKALLKAYEKMLEGFEKVEEVHARHILVPDETKARELIKKLESGGDFMELAKESTDSPTAQNGGDLGFFAKTDMVPEFANAAFALAPGAYSKDPVKTQFGWHVIKVEEKRQRPEPKFEAVKPQLDAQIRREELNKMLETWQKEASIKKFDINGDPVKEETKKN